ncbi:hypothetical protein SynBIOSE41_02778 [Synechococcus sp. BIOS-E4-1]|nr:hypothetical protein SynBIOSE41_02778 [Synechococcus sp. BIOS-E4-1]
MLGLFRRSCLRLSNKAVGGAAEALRHHSTAVIATYPRCLGNKFVSI